VVLLGPDSLGCVCPIAGSRVPCSTRAYSQDSGASTLSLPWPPCERRGRVCPHQIVHTCVCVHCDPLPARLAARTGCNNSCPLGCSGGRLAIEGPLSGSAWLGGVGNAGSPCRFLPSDEGPLCWPDSLYFTVPGPRVPS
jgi:hypothetical protein